MLDCTVNQVRSLLPVRPHTHHSLPVISHAHRPIIRSGTSALLVAVHPCAQPACQFGYKEQGVAVGGRGKLNSRGAFLRNLRQKSTQKTPLRPSVHCAPSPNKMQAWTLVAQACVAVAAATSTDSVTDPVRVLVAYRGAEVPASGLCFENEGGGLLPQAFENTIIWDPDVPESCGTFVHWCVSCACRVGTRTSNGPIRPARAGPAAAAMQ